MAIDQLEIGVASSAVVGVELVRGTVGHVASQTTSLIEVESSLTFKTYVEVGGIH